MSWNATSFEESLEFGHTKGLGLLKGKVLPFSKTKLKIVPHMNWNNILIKKEQNC